MTWLGSLSRWRRTFPQVISPAWSLRRTVNASDTTRSDSMKRDTTSYGQSPSWTGRASGTRRCSYRGTTRRSSCRTTRAHRGHGVGRALKIANLRQLAAVPSAVQSHWVQTSAAPTNTAMLALNEAIGFRTVDKIFECEGKVERLFQPRAARLLQATVRPPSHLDPHGRPGDKRGQPRRGRQSRHS